MSGTEFLEQNHEGEAIRKFYNFHNRIERSSTGDECTIDSSSYVMNSKIKKGNIKNSLLIGVTAEEINVENCILIMVTVAGVTAVGCLLYNVVEEQRLELQDGTVRADSFIPFASHHVLSTSLDRDGGVDWQELLSGNELSYEKLHELNSEVDIVQAELFASTEHQRVSCAVFETIW